MLPALRAEHTGDIGVLANIAIEFEAFWVSMASPSRFYSTGKFFAGASRGGAASRATTSGNARTVAESALEYTPAQRARMDILLSRRAPLTSGQIDNFRRYLLAQHPESRLYVHGAGIPRYASLKPIQRAKFGILPNGNNTFITIRPTSTGYDLAHEYLHMIHYQNVRARYGDNALVFWTEVLTSKDKEQVVYNELRQWWRYLSPDEQRNATWYVMKKGGFAGD
jgi:hypothetical protein